MGWLFTQPAFADSLNLAWDANVEPVSGYAVYVGVTSGTYTQRFDVGGATSFTFSNATAGQRYCFAVTAYSSAGESAKSAEVCGAGNQYPVLSNPGTQSATVGQSTSLQLVGSDPDGQAVTFSATNLPAGLTLSASTGFISGTGTTAGTFSVTARVSDGILTASQAFNWTMAAAPAPPPPTVPSPDTTAPSVSIMTPTTGSSFTSTSSAISLAGTGADNVGVTQVSWVNDRGGNGMASGTANWSVGSVALQGGTNNITVSARDAAGNIGTDVLSVTYTPPVASTSVVLSAQIGRDSFRWKRYVSLSWTKAPWSGVYVYRNGSRITRTPNDGSFSDSIRSSGTYNYKICDPNGTVCSNTVTVYW
ncbi:MAG TPA: putative Ig domain-containing protein [Vicinamibacterales bacterium]|nr:putative Ig domain-containing protein [Vicinamibacterales bacterium]